MNGRENLFLIFNKYDELLLTGTVKFEQRHNFFPSLINMTISF